MITAKLTNHRQSPRKMRVVANLIRGKKVSDAQNIIKFQVKKAKYALLKLLESAIANAKNQNIATDNLVVKEIRVDGGITMKRSMPRAFGRAYGIRKKSSHVILTLVEGNLIPEKGTTKNK